YTFPTIFQVEFDRDNRQVGSVITLWGFQTDPIYLHWLEITPGRTFGDLGSETKYSFMIRHLQGVGTPATTIPKVLQAGEEYSAAQAALSVAYFKGELAFPDLRSRLTTLNDRYRDRLVGLLGPERYEQFLQSIERDPLNAWQRPGADH